MLKSLLFTSLVCLALGGGALSATYPQDMDSIDTYEFVSDSDDPKLFSIGSIYGLDFSYVSASSLYDGRKVQFRNNAPIVESGLVLVDHQYGEPSLSAIRVAMYITTFPFYNSVMWNEIGVGQTVFQNTSSDVLFLHMVFSSTGTLDSTAMISIPLGFRESNYLPVNWWENGGQGLNGNHAQVFFKAKQLHSFSLSFDYDFADSILFVYSKLYYYEDGVSYSHITRNDIALDDNDFVKFFGDAEGRVERNMEWDEELLERSFYELRYFSLNRVPMPSLVYTYDRGYQVGYNDGLNQNINNGGLFSVFTSMFAGLSSFLAISLFPGVTIGGIALIFLVIPLTYGIIKLMRGGGG